MATRRALCALFLAVSLTGAVTAQSSVDCTTILQDHSQTTAFALNEYVHCLNTTSWNSTLVSEYVETIKTSARLHSLAPDFATAISQILEASSTRTPNLFQMLLELQSAVRSTRDKHFAIQGPPFFSSMFVIRLLTLSLRSTSSGGVELYVKGAYSQSIIDSYRRLSTLSNRQYSIPEYAEYARAINKTVTAVNGVSALAWARRVAGQVNLDGASNRLNNAVQNQFLAAILDEHDLVSPAEQLTFADGTSLTALRVLLKATSGSNPSCTLHTPTASASRRQAGDESTAVSRGGFTVASQTALREALMQFDDAPSLMPFAPSVNRAVAQAVSLPVDAAIDADKSTMLSMRASFNETLEGFGGAFIRRHASKTVAVLWIKTFQPPQLNTSSTFNDFVQFFEMMRRLQDAARSAGVTELVIDVAGNTGGFVALQDLFLRTFDERYNLYWERISAEPLRVRITNPTDVNVKWSRSYLRTDVQSSALGGFYTSLLNATSVYSSAEQQPRTDPAWFDPVGRTFSGMTPFYHRPALFFINHTQPFPFSTITVLNDGFCGSSCCLFVERLKRFGVTGATTRFVGFGGDPDATSFQMGEFCGGSVQGVCAALLRAEIASHPHQTGPVAVDSTFVDTVWYATRSDSQPVQLSVRAMANSVTRDYEALGGSTEAHERRLESQYGAYLGSSSVARGLGAAVIAAALWIIV